MTYNIRFGECASMRRLAEEIKAQNPDFVALQEVDVNTMRTAARGNNKLNYINELAYHTGMFGHYGRTFNFAGGYYGIGILSRHPARSIEVVDLPNPDGGEQRVLLKGNFLIDGTKPITFACTHFDHKSDATRTLQATAVVGNLLAGKLPTIVCGDFNAQPDSEAIKIMTENAAMLCGLAPTYPANGPEIKIDYIFGLPANAFRLLDTAEGPVSPTAASDHIPVISTIVVE